jgi:hypothetical protein
MKKLRYIFTLLFFLVVHAVFAAGPEEEWDKLVKEGARQLNALIKQNEWNDAHGLSHLNNYVFSFNPQDNYLVEKQLNGGSPFYTQGGTDYLALKGTLAQFNNSAEVNPKNIKYYVCLASKFKVYKTLEVDETKLQAKIDNLKQKIEEIEGDNNDEIRKNLESLEKLQGDFKDLIAQVIEESKLGKEQDKVIFSLAYVDYYDNHPEGLEERNATISNFFFEGKQVEENSDKLHNTLPKYGAIRNANKDKSILYALNYVVDESTKILDNPETFEKDLSDVVFASSLEFNSTTRAFTGNIQINELKTNQKEVDVSQLDKGKEIIVADYVGLEGKSLSFGTDNALAKTLLKFNDRIKVCITNESTHGSVRHYLENQSHDTDSELGRFMQLGPNEMMLWVHFTNEGKHQVQFWFAATAWADLSEYERNHGIMAQILDGRAFLESIVATKYLAELFSDFVKGAKVPEQYWNPNVAPELGAYPEYMPVALAVIFSDVPGMVKLAANGEIQYERPDDFTRSQLNFALFCGAYNETIDIVAETADLVALIADYSVNSQFRGQINEAISNSSISGLASSIGQAGLEHISDLSQLDCKSAYLLGGNVIQVASLFIGLGELKIAAKSGKGIKALADLAKANALAYLRMGKSLARLPRSIFVVSMDAAEKAGRIVVKGTDNVIATIEGGAIKAKRWLTEAEFQARLPTYSVERAVYITPDGRTMEGPLQIVKVSDGEFGFRVPDGGNPLDEFFSSLAQNLKNKIDGLSQANKEKLLGDLGADPVFLAKFEGNVDLVDAWKALGEFPNLRKIPYNLEVLNKVKGKFTYSGKTGLEALEEIFSGHRSAQNFINNLEKAEEFFAGVGIKHWSGIKSAGEVRLINDVGIIVGKVENGAFSVTAPKGSRPAPRTYLTQEYINDHLVRFTNEGIGSRIVLKKAYNKYGIGKPDPEKTEFISLKSDMDRLISESNGDIGEIAQSLGIDESQLAGGTLVRVDIKFTSKNKPHIPSGNEYGTNEKWIPGGKLPDGDLEVIVKTKGMVKDVDYVVTDLATGKTL